MLSIKITKRTWQQNFGSKAFDAPVGEQSLLAKTGIVPNFAAPSEEAGGSAILRLLNDSQQPASNSQQQQQLQQQQGMPQFMPADPYGQGYDQYAMYDPYMSQGYGPRGGYPQFMGGMRPMYGMGPRGAYPGQGMSQPQRAFQGETLIANKLFVGGLSYDLTEPELVHAFARFGAQKVGHIS